MTDEQLKELLQGAIPALDDEGSRRDPWPLMATRFEQRPRWSSLDCGLAAAAVVALAAFPEWLWLLVYHL